jgi:phosphoglycolate phosphatase-like HAD superfamily hydrolase
MIIDGKRSALILDCDGTLVRINRSYNACIIETVHRMLSDMLNSNIWKGYVNEDLILAFRMSGGFNNDVDTCYALILSAVASCYDKNTSSDAVERARRFAYELADNADTRGIASVEEYLEHKNLGDVVRMVKDYTGYPGLVGSSRLATLFDELFYGKELFVNMHGIKPRFIDDDYKGFINYDEVIISKNSLEELKRIFDNNIAIVSGRSRLATEYTLKELLEYFNIQASVFIEDEDKYVKRNKIDMVVTKPNPYALLKSLSILNVKEAIVVGDSIEDLVMANSIDGYNGYKTIFIGVYGTSIDSNKQRSAFISKGAYAVIENINLLPSFLLNSTL